MVASRCLCWVLAATVPVAVAGHGMLPPAAGRITSISGDAPSATAAQSPNDRGHGHSFSMLDAGSDLDESGATGAKHPMSWLFDAWAHQASPASPVASPFSGASLAPVTPGGVLAAPGLTPVPVAPMAVAAAPAAGAMLPLAAAAAQPPTAQPAPRNDVAQMRNEISELHQEVVSSNKDMWNAVKLIASTVEKDETAMKAITQDVQMLRGRHGGSVPLVATECSMRQSSCSECLSVPSCVWCKVEQRCFSGDSAGPVRGECTFFRHGTCG